MLNVRFFASKLPNLPFVTIMYSEKTDWISQRSISSSAIRRLMQMRIAVAWAYKCVSLARSPAPLAHSRLHNRTRRFSRITTCQLFLRERNDRTCTSLLPGRVKHLDRVKPPSHTRERNYVERIRQFLQQEQAKLRARLTLGALENRIAPVFVVFLEKITLPK